MRKILVGLSGGVDSSLTLNLLHEQGEILEPVFMKNWEEDDTEEFCAHEKDASDAEAVAKQLGLPLHRVNFAAEYWEEVFSLCLEEFKVGKTPNPDILCNRFIKFSKLFDYADLIGCSHIATGHYARIISHPTEGLVIGRGKDANKDQSYFLWAVPKARLERVLFPLGEYEKTTVRTLAAERNLVTAHKKDSTGICFVGERPFMTFLQRFLPKNPGPIINEAGQILGEHEGVLFYTLGQRSGLKIGGIAGHNGNPWYVIDKDCANNTLIVASEPEHPALYKSQLSASHCNWFYQPQASFRCSAKIRYRQADVPCEVQYANNQIRVDFDQPQRAVTPGQSVVLYDGDAVIGGGIIDTTST